MNHMTADGMDAPWNDDQEKKECPDCKDMKYICEDCGHPTDDKLECKHCGSGWVYPCERCR